MATKYVVNLTGAERTELLEIVTKGRASARRLKRAHILLHADEGATDEAIAKALHTTRATVERTRKRFVLGNLQHALTDKFRCGGPRKLNGKQEAFLIATACTAAPEGRTRWTMQLLADRLVELKQVDSVSDETVRRTLKKTNSSRG